MLIYFMLVESVLGKCAFTQTCAQPPFSCNVPVKLEPQPDPKVVDFSMKPACPWYVDKPVCCNDDQNTVLNQKYVLIDYTMGAMGGGCDVCGANMKKLWCEFTCNPLQAEFVDAGIQKKVQDPLNPNGPLVQVLMINFTVTSDFACALYISCKKTPYVTEVSAMHSSLGFLQFQGINSIEMGSEFISFFFSELGGALNATLVDCNYNNTEVYGIPITPCTCNNCEDCCQTTIHVPGPALLNRMNTTLIAVIYVFLALFSIVVLFFRMVLSWHEKARRRTLQTTAAEQGLNEQ